MDINTVSAEQTMLAYARAKARGVQFGTSQNPRTYKSHSPQGKANGAIEAALPQMKGFAPQGVGKALVTADAQPVTYPRIVAQWVAIAFNPEEATACRMRALEKVERILISVANAHPAMSGEIDQLSKTARKAARSPASNEGRQAADAVSAAVSGGGSLKYGDFVQRMKSSG